MSARKLSSMQPAELNRPMVLLKLTKDPKMSNFTRKSVTLLASNFFLSKKGEKRNKKHCLV